MKRRYAVALAVIVWLAPGAALAAPAIDGAGLGWPWALPFLGLLLSIALGPTLFPRIWHAHYGKLAYAWCVLTLVPMAALSDIPLALSALAHALLAEYLSFIVLLFALYVVAGGIVVTGNLRGTPLVNAGLLAFGALIASLVGTAGAALVLIRPLLRANINRLHNAHVVVFFIFLVANIGGALSPLGSPPLYVGYLHGVDFLWTAERLHVETAVVAGIVLAAFLVIDVWLYRRERRVEVIGEEPQPVGFGVRGLVNLLLLAAIAAAVVLAAAWKPGVTFPVWGTALALQDLVRDTLLVMIALLSLVLTHEEHREANGFTWGPMRAVVVLFGAIFICVVPVVAMVHAGRNGAFGWVHALAMPESVPSNVAYFWLTGLFSAFLSNAPAYRLFFELAGGDASLLMGPFAATLAAISMGAVFMGALTYIGSAPGYMVYAIALERGVRMPGFFGFLAWSLAVIVPVMLLVTFVFVARP